MDNHRILVSSKHLLDLRDAQAQQTRSLILALEDAGLHVDVVTGNVAQQNYPTSTRCGEIHALDAYWHRTGDSLTDKISRKLTRNFAATGFLTGWARRARERIRFLLQSREYACLLSIGSPMESHIAALNSKTSTPWVACMSDPWPESILPAPYSDFALPVLNALQKRVVAALFRQANRIVVPTFAQAEFLKRHYRGLDLTKVVAIPHIAPQFRHRMTTDRGGFKIVHAGALSRERSHEALAIALASLPDELDLVVQFVGTLHPSMIQYFERHGVTRRIELLGWRDKGEAADLMAKADALLLIEAKMDDYPFLPSKIADYSAVGAPVIAITSESSPSARIIRKHQAGYVTGYDAKQIVAVLLEASSRKSDRNRSMHEHFSSETVALQYIKIFNDLARTLSS